MLTPDYYESCADDIIRLYEQLENDIISDVIRRIMKTGKVTATAEHQLRMIQNAGLLYDDVISEIAKRTDATEQHVRALFLDAGIKSVEFDNQIYRAVGRVPVDIRQSEAMRQVLEAGYQKTLGNMRNLTMTTANTSQTAYYNACNQAYMKVTSGAFSYQEAIKQAVQKTAQDGAYVLYPSGHRDRVDVAVRRAVLTGVGQTCREIGLINAQENDCDLMEISAHFGARPSHAEWQGQIVSLSGQHGYLSKDDIGYGTGDGFGGWNCRHDWFPYFKGYSKRNYSDSYLRSLNEKNISYNGEMYSQYEISQIQRKLEREIRSAKREKTAFDTAASETNDAQLKAAMQSGSDFAKQQIRDKQAQMRDLVQQTGQERDYFREQNYDKNTKKHLISKQNNAIINYRGSGKIDVHTEHYYEFIGNIDYNDKIAVAKTLLSFEKENKNSTIEKCIVITPANEIYMVYGDTITVNTGLLKDKMKGSINEHNHVTGQSSYSFSYADLKSSILDGSKKVIAFDEKYRYIMKFSDKIISKDEVYETIRLAEIEVIDQKIFHKNISDEDELHKIIENICKRLGIEYERKRI